jgi:hypothetical protein
MAFNPQRAYVQCVSLFFCFFSDHPELKELRRAYDEIDGQIVKRGSALRKTLASYVEALEDKLPSESDVWRASDLIMKGGEIIVNGGEKVRASFARPDEIVASISSAKKAIRCLLKSPYVDEVSTKKVVSEHAGLLHHLIPLKTASWSYQLPWPNRRENVRDALLVVNSCLSMILSRSDFSQEKVEEEQTARRKAEETLRDAETRISEELVREARVLLCTIGSSHKLPLARKDDDGEADLSVAFGQLSLVTGRSTIVVFDEAGCIPDYEFLGLSRLGRDIKALVCVGDKHQLPPFSAASANRTSTPHGGGGGGFRGRRQTSFSEPKVISLLDVSAVEKIKLTTQYRVPHDIANLLNDRIYRGDYKTAPTCKAPLKGFKFVHVPGEANRFGGKQYVNDREIQECIRILRELRRDGITSIMVLTPVRTIVTIKLRPTLGYH